MDYLAALLYIILAALLLHNMVCSQVTPVFPDVVIRASSAP